MKYIHLYVSVTFVAILACVGCRPDVSIKLEKSRVSIADPPFDLEGGIPVGGRYEGRGVSNNRFSPEEAGVGVHEIVYTYMGFSASNSIEVSGTSLKLGKKRVFIGFPPFELMGGSPVGGRYEGRGVSNNRFSPEEAGVGVHEIVYTYRGLSVSDSIEVFGARQRRADVSCTICNGTGLIDCVPRVACIDCTRGLVSIGNCLACDGAGHVRTAWKLWLGTRDCPDCQGTGLRYVQCKKCKGRAYLKCPDCKGTGKAVCKCVK